MKITYDPKADAMYILFQSEGAVVAETREASDDVLIDFDENENIVGLEVLFASRQMPLSAILSVNIEGLLETSKVA